MYFYNLPKTKHIHPQVQVGEFVFACNRRVDLVSSKPVPSSEDIRQKGNAFYKSGKVSEGF